MTFEELNLAPAIVQAVHDLGYETPTPIQVQAIPAVLQGRDLLAGAQTGTGKTAAYSLPVLQRLSSAPQGSGKRPVRALVLAPTRELAAQVEESIRQYAANLDIRSTVIFGGVGAAPQIERLRKGVDVLVATPGRLLDLASQNAVDLSKVEYLVLDEADRMLDMGFIHDVKKVLALLPAQKQSLLFSATFSDEIRTLAAGLLHDPLGIQVTPSNTTVQLITQVIHPVGRTKKKAALLHVIQSHNWSQVLVFTRTKYGANNVAEYLNKNGVTAMALHGNKSQTARTQALAGFKTGEMRALVATDIAARGIDIDDLPHVVNYDIPNVSEDYVHRIGRTGRAGASGTASSLVCMDEEGFMQAIERFTRQEIPVEFLPGEFAPEPGERAEPIAMGRQTLWGGLGKAPSREVMQAAARAARGEMMQRIREKKDTRPAPRKSVQAHASNEGADARFASGEDTAPAGTGMPVRRGPGARRPRQGVQPRGYGAADRKPRPQPARSQSNGDGGADGDSDRPLKQPRHYGNTVSPSQANAVAQRRVERSGDFAPVAGQPDPLRTSVDSFAGGRGRRSGSGGGGGNNRRSKPGARRSGPAAF